MKFVYVYLYDVFAVMAAQSRALLNVVFSRSCLIGYRDYESCHATDGSISTCLFS